MWDEIYEAHHNELLRWCAAACHDMELAEDLAQETFLKALQSADLFEDLGPSQRRAWLFRTMKNLLVDRCRRAKLEQLYTDTYPQETVEQEPGYGSAECSLLLAQLPPEDRALFHLRYVEGYNASELAQLFHMPPGTVRAKLSRSRLLLKNMLTD